MYDGMIMTVRGPMDPARVQAMCPHEHVVHRFGDAPSLEPDYDTDHVVEIAVPALRNLLSHGCNVLADCTTAWFGRSVEHLRMLSEESGVAILANTGYYGAANDRYVPDHAYSESAEAVAARWIAEWENGIEGSGIRPGFIKVGVDDPAPLSEVDAKLVRAAAKTHLATGLVMEVHSPKDGSLAQAQLAILDQEGVSPEAWIWVHADTVEDVDAVVGAARRGAWVEFDSIKPENVEQRVGLLQRMKREGLLEHVLLSHDEASYMPDRDEPEDVHVTVFTKLLPRLREEGFSDDEIATLTAGNPRRAFAVGARRLE